MDNEVVTCKRVTANFLDPVKYGQDSKEAFDKWKKEMTDRGAKVAYDRRNNIFCVAPTMDYEMYYNYVMYLNTCHNEWLGAGYFDAGMVPYMMWPSFMDSSGVMEQMRGIAKRLGLDLIAVPGVSFLKHSYISNGTDYWVFKEDLYKMACIMQETNPSLYAFNFKSPSDASLSGFLRPLAKISAAARVRN